MGYTIFPTNGDVATTTSNGETISEQNMVGLLGGVNGARVSYLIDGLDVSTASGLVIDIAAGSAFINGVRFEFDTAQTHTATDSLTDYYLQLRLDRTATLISGYTLVESATAAPIDDDHVALCRFTSATTITSLDRAQCLHKPRTIAGQYEGDGTTNRTIDIGFVPRFVNVWASSGANRRMGYSVILPDDTAPSTLTSVASMTWDNSAAASWTTSRDERPEIADTGFIVSSTGAGDLNDNSVFYNYIATA